MSSRFAFERLADVRHDGQLLIDRAGDQESQLPAVLGACRGGLQECGSVVGWPDFW